MRYICLAWLCIVNLALHGQTGQTGKEEARKLSMEEVLILAGNNSMDAILNKHRFLSAYWQYRSHLANLLPSLKLDAEIPYFSRALVPLQNPETGEFKYTEQYSMRNKVNLSVDQKIAATGGKITLTSNLERLDQYKPERYYLYNSNPVSITFSQPIWGNINRLKWDKKIEPEKYAKAKYEYLEGMEAVNMKAVNLYFNVLNAQQNLEKTLINLENTKNSYKLAQRRFEIGTIDQNELMQLEVRLLNEELSLKQYEINLKVSKYNLASFLGFRKDYTDFELSVPQEIPDIMLDYTEVFELSTENTSFNLTKKIDLLQGEMNVAQARANRGLSADLFVQFGLNQSASKIGDTYRNLREMENIKVGIQVPIVDWGMGRGRVKTQESQLNIIKTQIAQGMLDHEQDIMIKVLQFNNQKEKCRISEKTYRIANERYEISTDLFMKGKLSVLEYNTAQNEKDNALLNYITELSNYWNYYFTLQKITLFDFRNRRNISADFDLLISD